MKLNVIRHGTETGAPPLIIAHGLFGSARNWGVIAKRLGERRPVVAVDLRNHGDSPHAPDHAYAAMAEDLAAVIADLDGPVDVLGHSMGGKVAMTLALSRPQVLRRLIVVDIAPVAYGQSQMEYVRAMQAVDLSAVTRRSDADALLAAHVPDASLRAFFLQSLAVEPEGARWKLNLEVLGDQMPLIMDFPDIEGVFAGHALFLCGGLSDYVRAAHWPQIRARFPAAERIDLPGVGHWLHAEAPRPFGDAVEAFLDR